VGTTPVPTPVSLLQSDMKDEDERSMDTMETVGPAGARRTEPGEHTDGAGALLRAATFRDLCALVLCACLAGLILSFSCLSAQAATTHNFQKALTEAAPGTNLEEPTALAVDRKTGRIFLADESAGVVDIYDASGTYLAKLGDGSLFATGVAVDEASGLLYAADSFSGAILVFRPSGGSYEQIGEWTGESLPGEGFGEVSGVAVDNSAGPSAGDVYLIDAEDPELGVGVADVFKPNGPGLEEGAEGDLVRVLSAGKMEEPNGVAIDPSSGKVYIADSAKGQVYEFSATGAAEGKLNGKGSPQGSFAGPEEEEGNVTAVAIDPGSGDLLVGESERHVLSEFNPAGEWIGWVTQTPSGALGEPHAVAVDSEGKIYLADALQAKVDVFGPGVIVPDVATAKASKVTRTSATLSGTVNGQGKASHYFFQYGTTETLGSTTSPVAFSGSSEEKVSQALSELKAGTTYFFRLVAENENGANYGLVRELQTQTAVEGLSTGPVQNLQPASATLTGTLAPNGFDAHYYFQWGTSTAYGKESPAPPGTDAGEGAEAVAAQTDLEGLTPNTTYHYRLVASNSLGSTFGQDKAFTTSGPPRITYKPTSAIGHEEATLNAEVNPGELETTYRFEYGETTAYGTEVPIGGQSIGSGAAPVPVTAPLTSLKLGVTYHFRVVGENSAGTTVAADQKFTTIPPAPVDASYSTDVGPTEATLHTLINPLGNDTHYFFQYGTESCAANPAACTDAPAAPGEDIGAGTEDVAKAQKLTGLAPGTTYFYRVLATNTLGTTQGPERAFTTPEPVSSFALPDSRAWEMVSPPDKEGAPVEALTREGGVILASEDGNRLTYVVDGVLGEAEGNRSPEWQQILAGRGANSWASQDIATPNGKATGITAGSAPEYQFFAPDLSTALVEPAGLEPPLAAGVKQATPYLRDNAIRTYLPLVTEANVAVGALQGAGVHFVDASPDLSAIVIVSTAALLGPGSAPGLYEWTAGALQFVSVLPNGTPATEAELGFRGRVLVHSISDAGTRIVWTRKEENAGGGHLYMRDTAKGQTIQLDQAVGVAEPSKGSAQFQAASHDGSRIFFTDKQRLTHDSTAEPAQGVGKPDLYECEILEEEGKLACRLKDLTIDAHEGEHAFVQNLIFGADEDGSSAYLVAQGVLAGNENGNGETAQAGKYNLYHLHDDGSQWTTAFVATLSGEDFPEWEGNNLGNTAFLTARVSPNGRYLAFMSSSPITGYDNVDAGPAAKGARDEEVYLYDSDAASLTCVSCNPTGQRPLGVLDHNESGEGLGLLVDRRKVWAEFGHERWLAGNIPGWTAQTLTSAVFQSRYLSDEGRLYFNSPDGLVPAAVNRRENVYEYEPSGVGSCEAHTGGCVALLSPGTSERESAFLEATPSGGDVFFVTESNLLPQDTDTAFDIYDARTCSAGSPCQTIQQPPPGGCTEAGTCRPSLPPQQSPGGPGGSAAFSGPGNAAQPPPQVQAKGNQASKPTTKPLTGKQKLAKGLMQCRRKYAHSKKKRKACESHARRLSGARGGKRTAKQAKQETATQGAGRKGGR
jgi:hypothetical protein